MAELIGMIIMGLLIYKGLSEIADALYEEDEDDNPQD